MWSDQRRKAEKLLRFAETEARGGRDLARAAEATDDALLRRLYLRHASDEQRHAELFRARGQALRPPPGARPRSLAPVVVFQADWLSPGERGLDSVPGDEGRDGPLLAFLHLSEAAAAGRFALYRQVLADDPATESVFAEILRDEEFHMTYTRTQLGRVAPARDRRAVWRARAGRLWRAYLRLALALASLMGAVLLTVQYFVLIPPFAWAARRAARRESAGWRTRPDTPSALESQY